MSSGRLKDRIALITGASRGIGRAVAIRFAQEGAHVLLLARKLKALEAVDDAIKAAGGKATLIPLDLTDGKAIDALGPSLYERFGRLDVLVGNAAILGGLSPLPHIPVGAMGADFRHQCHRQLAADPHPRSSAPRFRCRPGDLRHFERGALGTRLLGALLRLQGRARMSGQDLRQRDGRQPRSRSTFSILAPSPPRMRAEAYPGEDPATLRTPEDVAEAFVLLAMASCDKTGQIVEA